MNPLNKDVNQIIFDCLQVPEKYNFYLYCKENNLTDELVYIERYFQLLYNITTTEWLNIIINNEHKLHYDFISKYKDVIDWHMLSIYQTFTPQFLIDFSVYIDWDAASRHQTFTIDSLQKHRFLINWDLLSARVDLNENILDIFPHLIKWQFVKLEDCSDNFLHKYRDNINWQNVSFTNLERYEDYKDNIDWVRLSYHLDLSEDFMRTHQDLLDWNFLSSHQEMSNEFVQEFQDRINMETRNFFTNRRRRNVSPSFEIRGIIPQQPILFRQSRLRNLRPAFFEY